MKKCKNLRKLPDQRAKIKKVHVLSISFLPHKVFISEAAEF